jgi:predicted dinucleotide-binding enzyme
LALGMTRIGFIGSGHIGSTLARLAIRSGHHVVLSNSRGPQTLAQLVADLGPHATAELPLQVAEAGEIIVVAIPLRAYQHVPVNALGGKVVIDTNNYYWQRDGHIAELDAGTATSSGLLQQFLPTSHVVKAFNHIRYDELASEGTPPGAPDRRALAVFGDDAGAKSTVSALIDSIGYDVVDGGPLAESWRIEPGHPAYGPRMTADELKQALDSATR